MPKLKPGTPIPTPEDDAAIAAAVVRDPDSTPFTDEEWAKITPTRGTARTEEKVCKAPVSIRLDVRVLEAFKATGEGWQTRMNEALLQYAKSHGMIDRS